SLDERERYRANAAEGPCWEDRRRSPAEVWTFDGGEREPAKRRDRRSLPWEVKPAPFRILAFVHCAPGKRQSSGAKRENEVKDAAPSGGVHQQAAERRPDDEGEAVAARPDAERVLARLLLRVGGREQDEGHRQLQSGAEAADRPTQKERRGVRRGRAQDATERKERDAADEDAPA